MKIIEKSEAIVVKIIIMSIIIRALKSYPDSSLLRKYRNTGWIKYIPKLASEIVEIILFSFSDEEKFAAKLKTSAAIMNTSGPVMLTKVPLAVPSISAT